MKSKAKGGPLMGGGGTFYDRDVTYRGHRTSSGFSDAAQKAISRARLDETLLPKDRTLVCESKSPVVYAFDVTGSMGILPKIIWDKMPMIAGQIAALRYVEDPMVSLAAVGDVVSDAGPLQVCDFSAIRNLDTWLQKIWLEGNGGGQAVESYEFIAYYYARMVDFPNAETPIFIFTGDEGFRERLSGKDLERHFGGHHQDVDAKTVFEELLEKFKGNVFLIHRYYSSGSDAQIVAQWERVLGRDRVIKLPDDVAIADVTLGVFALVSGACTLDAYLEDMKMRDQSARRMNEVRKSLETFAAFVAARTTWQI